MTRRSRDWLGAVVGTSPRARQPCGVVLDPATAQNLLPELLGYLQPEKHGPVKGPLRSV
jgi:hypothetical protein